MPRRVLLVEDEVLIAMMVEDLLAQSGCESVFAATGVQALTIIAEGPAFNLAVIDLRLPDGNGLSVIRALWDRWPVPVIVSTGYQDLSDNELEALSPFTAPIETISKPWGEAHFLRLVRQLLPPSRTMLAHTETT